MVSKVITYLLLGVFFFSALFPGKGKAADTEGREKMPEGPAGRESGARQGGTAGTEQNEYGAILDRMGQEKQAEYMTSLKRINAALRNAYVGLAKNYTAYRASYERTKADTENRRSTPYYILKKMQDLVAERERMEADIIRQETEKKAFETEVRAFYQGKMPQELAREWNREEKEHAEYLNAIYRQVGWWLQIEDSRQWRNDESQLWDYLRQYYQDHPKELDILK